MPKNGMTIMSAAPSASPPASPGTKPLPGMPPVIGNDVYSQTRAGMLAPRVRRDPARLYVPDSSPSGHRVTVIDPRTRRIVRTIPAGYAGPGSPPLRAELTLTTA